MENKFVTVRGHQMRYIESGVGTPIVMVHGLGFNASAEQWLGVIPLLSDEYRCIAVDQVGWGWSDRPTSGFSFPNLVGCLGGFVEALELEAPVVMGHTLGGWTAALLALEQPQLVGRLVLANTAGLNPQAPRAAGAFSLPNRDETRLSLERTFEGSVEVTEAMVDDELARHDRPGTAEAYSAILKWVNDPEMRTEWSLEPRLSQIGQPTLVIWGADDPILGVEYGERAAQLLANGKIVKIEQGAHAPFARKPHEFVAALKAWLKES